MADILNYIEQLEAETEKEWFIDNRYEIKNHIHDGFLCEIKNKKLSTIKGNTLSGEVNAQDIIFEIDRLHNEIDLGDENKEIYIYYSLADQSADLTKPHNVVMSEDKIRFSWTIPSNATKNQGNIVIGIAIVGTEDGEEFVYKTRTTLYKVEKGFVLESNVGNVENDTWFETVIQEITDLKNTVKDLKNTVKDLKYTVEELENNSPQTRVDKIIAGKGNNEKLQRYTLPTNISKYKFVLIALTSGPFAGYSYDSVLLPTPLLTDKNLLDLYSGASVYLHTKVGTYEYQGEFKYVDSQQMCFISTNSGLYISVYGIY